LKVRQMNTWTFRENIAYQANIEVQILNEGGDHIKHVTINQNFIKKYNKKMPCVRVENYIHIHVWLKCWGGITTLKWHYEKVAVTSVYDMHERKFRKYHPKVMRLMVHNVKVKLVEPIVWMLSMLVRGVSFWVWLWVGMACNRMRRRWILFSSNANS
jgi:hypothetical protein